MNNVTAMKWLVRPIRNKRGGIIGILMVFLALIGGWYLYQSYTRGQVKSNLKSISNDYVNGVKKIIPAGK